MLGRGYGMTSSDLFIFMKNEMGVGGGQEPSLGGMGEYEDLCERWIYEGKVDQVWGLTNGLSPSL